MRYIAIAFLVMVSAAFSQDIKVVKGDKTSADKYFDYASDGATETYNGIRIHGRLTNTSPKTFDMVAVTLTVKDGEGKLIERDQSPVRPGAMGPGETSFHEMDIKVGRGVSPAVIEWSVTRALEKP